MRNKEHNTKQTGSGRHPLTKNGFEMLRERNNWTDVVYNWAILIGIIIPLGAFAMLGYFAFMFWILGVGA